MSYYSGVQQSFLLARPKGSLYEIVDAPNYNLSTHPYKHKTIRAGKDYPRGTSIIHELPVSYAMEPDNILRDSKVSYTCNDEVVDMSVADTFVFDGVKSVPVKKDVFHAQRVDKYEFFRQGWPCTDELFQSFPNKIYLQLVVNLIHRDPVSAALFSGKNEKTKNMSMHYDLRPPSIYPVSFKQFCVCIQVLAKLKTPRRSVMNYIVYEDFVRLYDCVVANSKQICTLVNDRCYAVGLFGTLSYVNHSCDPNCVMIGSPLGMHLIAIKDIRSGDELCVSYTPSIISEFYAAEHSKKEVAHNYGFFCVCESCRGRMYHGGGSAAGDKFHNFASSSQKVLMKYPKLHKEMEDLLTICEKETVDPSEVVAKCEHINATWGQDLATEPQLLFVIAKRYVRLLQPGSMMRTIISHRYMLWAEAYGKALEVAKGKDSHFAINALYYKTIYLLLFCDALMKKTYVYEKTGAEKDIVEQCKMLSADAFESFAKSYVDLRMKCRATLGSHYYIWFEFATFSNLDRLLMSMENIIYDMEKKKVDEYLMSQGKSLMTQSNGHTTQSNGPKTQPDLYQKVKKGDEEETVANDTLKVVQETTQ